MSTDAKDVHDLDSFVDLALLDLSTLNEFSILTNPERLERPKMCITSLKKALLLACDYDKVKVEHFLWLAESMRHGKIGEMPRDV